MKRILVALVVGAVLLSVVFGAAAALNMTVNDLQAGSKHDLKCDEDGVQIRWRDGWDNSVDDFTITEVVFGGVSESCNGLLLEVVLTDGSGNWLAQGTTTISATADPEVVPMSPHPFASDVEDIHVIIR